MHRVHEGVGHSRRQRRQEDCYDTWCCWPPEHTYAARLFEVRTSTTIAAAMSPQASGAGAILSGC